MEYYFIYRKLVLYRRGLFRQSLRDMSAEIVFIGIILDVYFLPL